MYIILTYDVNAKRVAKMLRLCRKYLIHEQESVFEGNITETNLNNLKEEINKIVNTREDAVCIYSVQSFFGIKKEQLGSIAEHSNII